MADAGFELLQSAPGRFAVRGAMTFATAAQLHAAGCAAIAASTAQDLQLDCAAVAAADSAGLAVLIDWLGVARARGVRLRLEGLPEALRVLARISELEPLLDEAS